MSNPVYITLDSNCLLKFEISGNGFKATLSNLTKSSSLDHVMNTSVKINHGLIRIGQTQAYAVWFDGYLSIKPPQTPDVALSLSPVLKFSPVLGGINVKFIKPNETNNIKFNSSTIINVNVRKEALKPASVSIV